MEIAATKQTSPDIMSPTSLLIIGVLGIGFYASGILRYQAITFLVGGVAIFWSLLSYDATLFFLLISLHTGASLDPRWIEFSLRGRWVFLFLFAVRAFYPLFMETRKERYSQLHWLFIAYAVIATFSAAGAFIRSFSIYRTISLWWLILAVAFAIWRYTDSREKVLIWVKISVLISTGFLFFGLLDKSVMDIFFNPQLRYKGIYANPNMLGVGMLFHVPASFFLWRYERSRNPQFSSYLFYAIAFFLGFFSLLASGSRASLVGVFVGGAVAFSFHYRSRFILVVVLLLFLLGIVYTQVESMLQSRFFTGVIFREATLETMSGRSELWADSLELSKRHPFLGWGFGTSDFVITCGGDPDNLKFMGRFNLHPHSSLIKSILETGIIGTTVYVLLLILIPMKFFQLTRKINSEELNMSVLALMAIFIGGLLNSFLESWLFSVGALLTFQFWWIAFTIYKIDLDINRFIEPGDKPRTPGLFI